jgi:hypothetical protein
MQINMDFVPVVEPRRTAGTRAEWRRGIATQAGMRFGASACFALIAARIFSDVAGRELMRTPTASWMAFRIAAAVGLHHHDLVLGADFDLDQGRQFRISSVSTALSSAAGR